MPSMHMHLQPGVGCYDPCKTFSPRFCEIVRQNRRPYSTISTISTKYWPQSSTASSGDGCLLGRKRHSAYESQKACLVLMDNFSHIKEEAVVVCPSAHLGPQPHTVLCSARTFAG